MIVAIVPCLNEEAKISTVISTLFQTMVNSIIVVANGCTDQTVNQVKSFNSEKITLLNFPETLGVDIPRAIGAKYAYDQTNAETFLFLDGDMTGKLVNNVNELCSAVEKKELDLALTNCYPKKIRTSALASDVLSFRYRLNKTLGLNAKLDVANPCHGPHALSRKTMELIGFKNLAKPPFVLALARKHNLRIDISTTVPHKELGSEERDPAHNLKIAETMIGDCIEAMCLFKAKPLTRSFNNKAYIGYNEDRRWDVLASYLYN